MPSLKILLAPSLLALLSSLTIVTAAPSPDPAVLSNEKLSVFIRDADNAYNLSPSMAHVVRARDAALPLHKRSYAAVQGCFTADCENCRPLFSGSFNSNTACIDATNTACLLVSNLDDAKVQFWNRQGCNGGQSTYSGCPAGANEVGAPGTNSIGVHVGC